MLKRIGAFLLVFAAVTLSLSSCSRSREVSYYQYFDTVITLSATSMATFMI